MNEIIPIHKAGQNWSDLELEDNFKTEKVVSKVLLIGLLAKRSIGNPIFLDLLKEEALSDKNRKEKFFGVIKYSWIPIIAILEHAGDNQKQELYAWLQFWTEQERSYFFTYIKKEKEFLSWFADISYS